ncbi:hypothetical protein [Brevibacterium zhoupengii]|uniref:hypothetical protein n=1 Tax=Brevibacterium zhoupengii TaxID=2898795 RepID=UPI001F08E2C8|nr:hypothetical protein [Brevibacterium zhoupengii]
MSVNDTIDPQAVFPDFYTNTAIKTLSGASRWTVSGRLGEESKGKAPIDMRHLLDTGGRVRGAWSRDEQCLVTLDDLTEQLPNAANVAYYLQATTDGLIVIDIEPSCPAVISAQLLALPETIYSEVSMSGRGYHLIVPLPENFHDHNAAAGKKVLREEHGYYEILLEHWCTFTRRPISHEDWNCVHTANEPEPEHASTAALYASLAKTAKATGTTSTTVHTSVETPEITGGEEIVSRTLDGADPRFKTLDDFAGDASRWEFSVLGTLYNEMRRHLVVVGYLRRTSFSDGDVAWLLFEAVQQVLPPRSKHRERRNGRPFLLDRSAAMVAENRRKAPGRPGPTSGD